jgi:hypothetical protein
LSIATHTAEVAQRAASAAQYGGGAGAFYFGMTANEVAAYGGLAIAALGFITSTAINWYFKAQHLRLAKERLEAPDE